MYIAFFPSLDDLKMGYWPHMRKPLIAIIAFVVSTLLAVVLLVLIPTVVVRVHSAIYPDHSGIGAVVGGISETAVFLMPLLCGVIGTLVVLHRIERKKI